MVYFEPFINDVYQFIPYDKEFFEALLEHYHNVLIDIGSCIKNHDKSVLIRNNEYNAELIDFLDGNGFKILYGFLYPTFVEIVPIYTESAFEEQLNEIAEKFTSLTEELSTPWEEVNTAYCALNEPQFEPDVPITVVITDKFYNSELKINQKEYTTVRAPP